MKFFADTASTSEIEYCFSRGVEDGITTNPKIMEATGDLSKGFIEACKSIVEKYPHVPVSLETDLRGVDMNNFENEDNYKIKNILLEQAYELAELGKNVIVKIPICEGGLLAAKELADNNIKTNITACMTPYQALTAAKYGKGYVSLFANRMLDSHIIKLAGYNLEEIITNSNWKEIVKQNKEKYSDKAWEITLDEIAYTAKSLENSDCELIIGSIRTPDDIFKIISAKPQIITIPTKIVKELEKIEELKSMDKKLKDRTYVSMNHPMTLYTLKEFEEAANIYRK